MRALPLASLLILLFALLTAAPARATQVEEKPAQCAACEKGFTAVRLRSSNSYGGIDADGCMSANGAPYLSWIVEVCPHCLCARLPEHRDRAPSNDAARAYLAHTAKDWPFPEDAAQGDIPVALKFRLAAELLTAEGAPPQLRAAVWLRGAWALRGEARAAHLAPEDGWEPEIPRAWRDLVEDEWELQTRMDRAVTGQRTPTGREIAAAHALVAAGTGEPVDDALRRLYLGVVLRCHGELPAAIAAFDELARRNRVVAGGPLAELSAEDRQVYAWIVDTSDLVLEGLSREHDLLGRAVVAQDEGDATPDEPRDFETAWLASECRRRLGVDEDAAAWLLGGLEADDAPDHVLVLLRDVAEWVGERSPEWAGVVREAWTVRSAALVAGLEDLEQQDDTAYALALLADRDLLPHITALLAHEDELTVAAALTALAGYERPDADPVARVERLVSDPECDAGVRWQAMEALLAWAEPTSVEAFKSVALEEGDDLLEPALRGLGLTGEPADIPAILSRADEEPEAATWALSLLTGQQFDDVDDFSTWHAENQDSAVWMSTTLGGYGVDAADHDLESTFEALLPFLTAGPLPVRWTAFRTLRAVTSESIAVRDILYTGRVENPLEPDEEIDLAMVLTDGWSVSWMPRPMFDLDDMGKLLQPLRDSNARIRWERAESRWREWFETR